MSHGSNGHSACDHEQRIHAALTRFHNGSAWQPVDNKTPLDELLASEDGMLDEWGCRHDVLIKMFAYLAEDGVHPGAVLRRIYALGKALHMAPWSLLSLEETAQMFGETRAAMSWRIKKIFTRYLSSRGFRGCKSPFQKSEVALAAYGRAQQGNQNRRGRPKPKSKKTP